MSEELSLRQSHSQKILQSSSMRVAADPSEDYFTDRPLVKKVANFVDTRGKRGTGGSLGAMMRSLLSLLPLPPSMVPSCRWLSLPPAKSHLGRRVTGTLFGHKKGHVSFSVQEDPRTEPVLLLELATPTSSLVKEMASGLVRIALECERGGGGRGMKLFNEPVWTMYCNGRKSGYAVSRGCGESDRHVLKTVETVSIGAGVIPAGKFAGGKECGELMYMRARFERVVGSRDSEAFYMLNPDGNGGPELSIFLLRI
ncbi:protein MIZU-KUSSEI 1-like [Aristolochia californica]|uniref:protein MIZU-KUSSEI 1-like n=1 Tax=Aristolochia californica TaxID=171875 RepID=UPI0035DBB60F